MLNPINGFPGYFIATNGEIWSKRGRRQYMHKIKTFIVDGYKNVNLYDEKGKAHFMKLHRILLTVFIGKCPAGMQACHNNGIRTDNRLENPRWDTTLNNQRNRYKHGTSVKTGSENSLSKWFKKPEAKIKLMAAWTPQRRKAQSEKFKKENPSKYYKALNKKNS